MAATHLSDDAAPGEATQQSTERQPESGAERTLVMGLLELNAAVGGLAEHRSRVNRKIAFQVQFTQRLGAGVGLGLRVENDCNILFHGTFPFSVDVVRGRLAFWTQR